MKENTTFTLHLGEAGSGKSYTIADVMKSDAENIETLGLRVLVPTHSAKRNLIKTVENVSNNAKMTQALSKEIQVLAYQKKDYDEFSTIVFDEIGMFSSKDFHAVLNQLKNQNAPVDIVMFGDPTQLQPPKGQSVIQTIIEYNYNPENWLEWLSEHPYDDEAWDNLLLPVQYGHGDRTTIKVVKHFKNYRFSKSGKLANYTGYSDTNFLNDLISSAYEIGHDGILDEGTRQQTNKMYQAEVAKAIVEYKTPVIVPTNDLIKQINESMKTYCLANGLDYESETMFVHLNSSNASEIHLNPEYKDLEWLQEEFAFPVAQVGDDYEYRNAMTTHSVQGQTFESVAYYIGALELPVNNKDFYSFNQFYTAISRAKKYFYLFGEKKTFKEMLTIFPKPVKNNPTDTSASMKATISLVNDLQNQTIVNLFYTPSNIYDLFIQKYNSLPNKSVNSKLYSQYEVIQYFDGYEADGGRDYKYLVSENISEWRVNGGKNSKGKGKVQKMLEGFTEAELEEFKSAASDRKINQDDFKIKYGITKRSAWQSLNKK